MGDEMSWSEFDGVLVQPAADLAAQDRTTQDRTTHDRTTSARRPGVTRIFTEQARRTPNAPALREGATVWSYAELDARSDTLAHDLARRGIGRGDHVLLALDRSIEAVCAHVAILKAGAVYVPLDLGSPAAQTARIVANCRPAAAIARRREAEAGSQPPAWECPTLWIDRTDSVGVAADARALPEAAPDDPAYVMYTSGSTGEPKGVVVPHRGIVRLVMNPDYARFGADDVFLEVAPMAFDAATLEIWGPLLNGGTLVILAGRHPSLGDIGDAVERYGVTNLLLTTGPFNLLVDNGLNKFGTLRQLLVGGDVLSPQHVRRALAALPLCRLINVYGPTENATFTCCYTVPATMPPETPIPIGYPIAGTQVYVLDAHRQPVADQEQGELCVTGEGLALGYLNRPDLTATAFVPDPFGADPDALMYLTGDRVSRGPDGVLQFHGRVDRQAKISGKRVELDAIEGALRDCVGVRDAAVALYSEPSGTKQIAAYLVATTGDGAALDIGAVRTQLARGLPPHMIPAAFAILPDLPLTANGKVDRRSLPVIAQARAPSTRPFQAPGSAEELRVARVWRGVLGVEEIGLDDSFFELGGTSLTLLAVQQILATEAGAPIAITDLFANPTIRTLAPMLRGEAAARAVPDGGGRGKRLRMRAPRTRASGSGRQAPSGGHAAPGGIAIIGLSGRFPGAATVDAFWRNLREGVDSISHFTDRELDDAFGPEIRALPNFVRARGILEDIDLFDADFFGMYPREAELTDPQHRILLECAWEALEDAGCDPLAAKGGPIGVFVGSSLSTYLLRNLCSEPGTAETLASQYQVEGYPTLIGTVRDFLATKISHKLDLRGPSITSLSACSTSLLCVTQACQSLLLNQCDMALAGGVSISVPQKRGTLHQDGGMVSADGTCRTFDADATGTVFGSGAALVLLKRVEDAVRDGDQIYATIAGFGVNNDGAAKIGFTAPSADGQAACILQAHAMAGVEAQSIGYVECHGTATPLGDPIELSGLTKAFRASSAGRQFCAIGSVKPNVGHLDAAAGVTGLIKTCLALKHDLIPPTVHYRAPNPRFDFADSPFFVSRALAPWAASAHPRRAGVSAFGVGGTNVHVVLEEAPARLAVPRAEATGPELLVLSARSETALAAARSRLAARLRGGDAPDLADVAFTLQSGRRAFPHRAAIVAADLDSAAAALESGAGATGQIGRAAPGIAFLIPGQGSQYPRMGRGLYETMPLFRETVDTCSAHLRAVADIDLVACLFPQTCDEAAHRRLKSTAVAQPAIFTIAYALAELWRSLGIAPRAMIGHSVGEFVSACLSGVMSLEDALRIVSTRGRLMQALPGGAMLAVRLSEAELVASLPPGVAIAAANAPGLSVASGSHEAIDRLEADLAARGVISRRLQTSHAFHSAMMDPIVEPMRALMAGIDLKAPSIPYLSSVTGTWITDGAATSPDYWARHAREPVRFHDGLTTLVADGATVMIEVGPLPTLATLARQSFPGRPDLTIVNTLSGPDDQADREALLAALGRVWIAGVTPDWSALQAGRTVRRVSLPTYPFERKSHWIEPTRRDDALTAPPVRRAEPPTPDRAIPDEVCRMDTRDSKASQALVAIFKDLSGTDISDAPRQTFLELGFDSLFLTQVTQKIRGSFGVTVTFRQLLGDLSCLADLARHVAAALPPAAFQDEAPAPATVAVEPTPAPAAAATVLVPTSGIESLMRDQLAAMTNLVNRQLEALRGAAPAPEAAQPLVVPAEISAPVATVAAPPRTTAAPVQLTVLKGGRGDGDCELTEAQRAHVADLAARVTRRTAGSKAYTERYRRVLADPRAVAGFRPEWKEMVYPIVTERSSGARLWDIDGNEYVDFLNGFGPTFFGHGGDFVVEAVKAQLAKGFEIGPQAALAGRVAELVCELTGNERATFCNTGSEAVMAAIRIARCVTGRDRVVMFSGSYHGQFDEVLVRAGGDRSRPAAPGIPAANVANMTVLDYGAAESLAWIRANAASLAAVIIEPVQSRHPGLRPQAFAQALREITTEAGAALIFDEVVTGFRLHPGGMQAVFGIRADLATYGKVVGGGMPIGILAGRAQFMDALDGGTWRFGDASEPEAGVTFVAGTFVRHPLALAAAHAVLSRLREAGPALQEALAQRTEAFVARLNAVLAAQGIASRIESYGSLFYVNLSAEDRNASLLYYHLRLRGIYIQDGFPCFLTTTHTEADLDGFVTAFGESLEELAAVGILCGTGVASADRARPPAPAALSVPGPLPLTEAQIEVWLSAQLGDAASSAFNESVSLRFEGALDATALAQALNALVVRHDALRLRFGVTGETQSVAPVLTVDLARTDLSDRAPEAAEAALHSLIADDAERPFALVEGPLMRAELVRIAPLTHVLVLTAHHIVCDGWSLGCLADELMQLYGLGDGAALAQPALPFTRYAAEQAAARRDGATVAASRYWQGQFAQAPASLDLPADRARPVVKTSRGATQTGRIEGARLRTLKAAAARQNATLFATLLAGFSALIGRLAEQTDVVVAVPFAGQALVEDQALVGHCVNLLPVRSRWSDRTTVSEHLSQTMARLNEAVENQGSTLGTIVRDLDLPRDLGRPALASVQFNLDRALRIPDLPGLTVAVTANPKRFANFDLFFNLAEDEGGLRIDCDYNTDLFDAATIARWIGHYATVLSAIAADPSTRVGALPLLSAAEREALIVETNRTATQAPPFPSVHAFVEAQCARTPDRIAVVYEGRSLTYRALDAQANRLARLIRARIPALPGARIGVLAERSPEMLVGLLAILKAGHAYVPLDPSHPATRNSRILADAGIAGVVTYGVPALPPLPATDVVIDLAAEVAALAALPETPLPATAAADAAAYVIYTSGSTGLPKGVEVGHRSVVNFLGSMLREPGLGPDDVLLAITTVSFDIAALELFAPLCIGATVIIASDAAVADTYALLDLIGTSAATVLQATPSRWRLLLEGGFVSSPGFKMLCGGEAVAREVVTGLLAGGGELWNLYGPTETTIWSAVERLGADEGPITIGHPIANTQLHVIDAAGEIAPLGVPGHLVIAGAGLAHGYVDRPDLTEAAFTPNPFATAAGQRLYRTGDRARRLADGRLQVIGRLDQQIKLRGVRIELGEIEAVLARQAGIAAAAVILREDEPGEPRLVSYYVETAGAGLGPADLRRGLAQDLPDAMVPSVCVRLDAMPMGASGKLDRNRLPRPDAVAIAAPARPARDAVALDPMESRLVTLWASVLRRGVIGIDDSIFDLGIDSLQVFQFVARANDDGVAVKAADVMKHRTVAALASFLSTAEQGSRAPARRPGPKLVALPREAFRVEAATEASQHEWAS